MSRKTEVVGTDLASAVDGLYCAFASYSRPQWFEGCSCCWGGDLIDGSGEQGGRESVRVTAPGESRPLRELGADELSAIAFEVPLTAGTLDVQKHYLPRILEIAVTQGFDWPDLEVVFYRLNEGADLGSEPWIRWPDGERDALQAFFRALWADRLATVHDDRYAVDSALCAIGVVEPDLDWYLAEWLRFEHPRAAENLLQFLQLNANDMTRGRLRNAFWDDKAPADENLAKVVAWAKADSTREAVAAAAERARTPEETYALEECYLRWLG